MTGNPVSAQDAKRRPTARGADGFTLVELVVTLVIIGALAVVSAPLFFSKQAFEDSGFYNETLAAVRYAQKLAVASGCTVRVSITATGYSLHRAAAAGSCNTAPFTAAVVDPSESGANFTRTAPSGTTLTPPLDFTFSPLGRASVAAPNQDITVSGSSGSRQLRVWAETGFVERL